MPVARPYLVQQPDHPRAASLLTRIQVDEAKHLSTVVHLCTHLLKLAPQEHIAVEILGNLRGDDCIATRRSGGLWWGRGSSCLA